MPTGAHGRTKEQTVAQRGTWGHRGVQRGAEGHSGAQAGIDRPVSARPWVRRCLQRGGACQKLTEGEQHTITPQKDI